MNADTVILSHHCVVLTAYIAVESGAQLIAHPADSVEKLDGADEADSFTSHPVRSSAMSRYIHLLCSTPGI